MAGVGGGLQDGDSIENAHHVMRYCRPKQVQRGKITESAFALREKEEYLSANWLEYFNEGMQFPELLRKTRETVGQSLNLPHNGRFAKIHVGDAKRKIKGVRIQYRPVDNNPAHAGIYPPSEKNREITLELANLVSDSDIFSAVE